MELILNSVFRINNVKGTTRIYVPKFNYVPLVVALSEVTALPNDYFKYNQTEEELVELIKGFRRNLYPEFLYYPDTFESQNPYYWAYIHKDDIVKARIAFIRNKAIEGSSLIFLNSSAEYLGYSHSRRIQAVARDLEAKIVNVNHPQLMTLKDSATTLSWEVKNLEMDSLDNYRNEIQEKALEVLETEEI